MHLVDMEGVAFARAIKSDPALAATQLVILTETAIDPGTAAQLGFSAWISKPCQPQTLLDRLAGLVESKDQAHRSAA